MMVQASAYGSKGTYRAAGAPDHDTSFITSMACILAQQHSVDQAGEGRTVFLLCDLLHRGSRCMDEVIDSSMAQSHRR